MQKELTKQIIYSAIAAYAFAIVIFGYNYLRIQSNKENNLPDSAQPIVIFKDLDPLNVIPSETVDENYKNLVNENLQFYIDKVDFEKHLKNNNKTYLYITSDNCNKCLNFVQDQILNTDNQFKIIVADYSLHKDIINIYNIQKPDTILEINNEGKVIRRLTNGNNYNFLR